FVVLITVPLSMPINCWIGGGFGEPPGVFSPLPCANDDSFYCYTRYTNTMGGQIVEKGCGREFCWQNGCDSSGLCCCIGDYCNAGGGSFVVIVNAARQPMSIML
ncbi:hypothetical protein PENTCL1PPCAC_28768, partial [Pristionchus entomophagus]